MGTLGLTPRQHELLTYLASQRVCPTMPQMADAIRSSKGGVHGMLTRLERSGYIRRLPRRVRAIEVIRQPLASRPKTLEERLAAARAWHISMKPYFDDLYGPPIRAAVDSYPFRSHRTCAEWIEPEMADAA
jgi:repressor LexA